MVQPDDLDMDEDADEQQAPKPNVTAKVLASLISWT